jgi:hypothetical protein
LILIVEIDWIVSNHPQMQSHPFKLGSYIDLGRYVVVFTSPIYPFLLSHSPVTPLSFCRLRESHKSPKPRFLTYTLQNSPPSHWTTHAAANLNRRWHIGCAVAYLNWRESHPLIVWSTALGRLWVNYAQYSEVLKSR